MKTVIKTNMKFYQMLSLIYYSVNIFYVLSSPLYTGHIDENDTMNRPFTETPH